MARLSTLGRRLRILGVNDDIRAGLRFLRGILAQTPAFGLDLDSHATVSGLSSSIEQIDAPQIGLPYQYALHLLCELVDIWRIHSNSFHSERCFAQVINLHQGPDAPDLSVEDRLA
jgi:hypothetical protein